MASPDRSESFFSRLISRLAKFQFFTVSFLIHLILVFALGSAVIVSQFVPPETFVAPSDGFLTQTSEPPGPQAEEPAEFQDVTYTVSSAPPSAPSASLTAIAVSGPGSSTWSVTAAGDTQSLGTLTTALSQATGSGNAPGGGGRGGSGIMRGTLFGKTVEAKKLGVILDVSGSAHAFLPAALREIDAQFSSSPTVFACGCGMDENDKRFTKSAIKPRIYGFGSHKPDSVDDKPGARTSLGQIAAAEAKFPDVKKVMDTYRRRSNVFVVQGGDIFATRLAFDKLISEGCDTIYWFADFADKVDPETIKRLTQKLKGQQIKVIAHNFSGKKVPDEQAEMATETGGQVISVVPK